MNTTGHLLTCEEAMEINEPCHSAWLAAHEDSVADLKRWRKAVPELFLRLREPELCAILHRHIAARATAALDGTVVVNDRLGFDAHIVDGKSLVRFKHLGPDLAPRSYPTEQQKHLRDQEWTEEMIEQLAEDGLTQLPTVQECGYTMDALFTELQSVTVVCWYKKQFMWDYSLTPEGGVRGAEVLILPGTPPPAPRIVPKKDKASPAETGEQSQD
jgi:hypothetical protein